MYLFLQIKHINVFKKVGQSLVRIGREISEIKNLNVLINLFLLLSFH